MTKREREQVVELLRCAADDDPCGYGLVGMFGTPYFAASVHRAAWRALNSFTWPRQDWTPSGVDEGYRHALLEAALRVEQGEWP